MHRDVVEGRYSLYFPHFFEGAVSACFLWFLLTEPEGAGHLLGQKSHGFHGCIATAFNVKSDAFNITTLQITVNKTVELRFNEI